MSVGDSRVRRGQLVWAKVVHPNQWLPGFVLESDEPEIGFLVSFFNLRSPRYFVASQLCSFRRNFKSLVGRTGASNLSFSMRVLCRALRSLSVKVECGLWCPCQPPVRSYGDDGKIRGKRRRLGSHRSSLFLADETLGFVRRTAVSQWIEMEDLADAAAWSAEILCFRRYSFDYDCSKIIYEATLGITEGENAESFCHDDLSESFHEDRPDTKPRTLMELLEAQSLVDVLIKLQFLAVDRMYLAKQDANSVKNEISSIRALLLQDISRCCLKEQQSVDCRKVPFYATTNNAISLNSQLGVEDVSRATRLASVTCAKSLVSHSIQKSVLYQSERPVRALKICKTKALSKCTAENLHGIPHALAPLPNISDLPASLLNFISTLSWNLADLVSVTFVSGPQVNLGIGNLNTGEMQVVSILHGSDLEEFVHHVLSSSVSKDSSGCNELASRWSGIQELKGLFHVFNYYRTGLSSVMKGREEGGSMILRDKGVSTVITHNVNNKRKHGGRRSCAQANCDMKSRLPSVTMASPDNSTGARNHNINTDCAVMASEKHLLVSHIGSEKHLSVSHVTSDQNKVSSGSSCDILSIRKRKPDKGMATGNSSKKTKLGHQHASTQLPPHQRSQADWKKAGSPMALHMKFPKNCALPSKTELVKVFSAFGKIDSYNTAVFSWTNAARVVFLEYLDAVAAYQYAKSQKVLLAHPNVLYWLDPFENTKKMKASEPKTPEELALKPCPKSSIVENSKTPIKKPCLKSRGSAEKETERGKRKVRFRIEING